MGDTGARVVSGGGIPWIARSKFGCPAVPVPAIARPRLGEVLAQPDWRVALVTGGLAIGRTAAVAQWFQTLGSVAREWVTLDVSHDWRQRFRPLRSSSPWSSAICGGFAQAAVSATNMHGLAPEFFPRLLTAWSAVKEGTVVVLEDLHHLRSP